VDPTSIRLTQTVKKGGCAAKLPASQLSTLLKGLPIVSHPHLLVGPQTLDDAALWDLGQDRLLVQTVDFFTPILDQAYPFGQVAAANALSDVYAMGGLPAFALTVLAWPSGSLPEELIRPLMEGGLDRLNAAGCVLAGGHSIENEALILGFCVTGFVEKVRAWTNAGCRPGDVLILTKALGTGTITSALKNGSADPAWVAAATASMIQLNDAVKDLGEIEVHAATDITGFGLAGHAMQMARASSQHFQLYAQALPTLPGALECLAAGTLNRAHHSNRRYVSEWVDWAGLPEILQWLVLDPQTSGGLLLSISEEDAPAALARLSRRFPCAAAIGRVLPARDSAPALSFSPA
jgi:selenide,water dikinase